MLGVAQILGYSLYDRQTCFETHWLSALPFQKLYSERKSYSEKKLYTGEKTLNWRKNFILEKKLYTREKKLYQRKNFIPEKKKYTREKTLYQRKSFIPEKKNILEKKLFSGEKTLLRRKRILFFSTTEIWEAGFFSLLADFLMSIYLKIITEQKNKKPEKKNGPAERKRRKWR